MKKILLSIIIALGLNANATYDSISDSYQKAGGVITEELKSLMKKDNYYQQVLSLMAKSETVTKYAKNPEEMALMKFQTKMVDWSRVYESLVLSNKNFKNPISAYYGISLINKYMGISNKLKDYKSFAETMYQKEKNMCESYLNYGAIYEKGIGVPIDFKKARYIYLEGNKGACKKGWQTQVVESKLWFLNRKLK